MDALMNSPTTASNRNSRRLRVAIYAPHFAEYSYRLASGLARHCDVRLVLNRKDANQQWELADIAVTTPFKTRIRDLSLRRAGAIGIPASFMDIISFRPDVVHCHEVPEVYTSKLIQFLRPLGIPLVLTVHDAIPHSEGGSGTSPREDGWRARMRAAASVVTTHGESCIADFRHATPDFNGEIVSSMHGVLMVPPTRAAAIEPESARILFFGRMWAYKGLDIFIDAIDLLDRRGVAHEAIVAGRGPEMTRLGARMEAMPTVKTIDAYISPEDTGQLFQSATVVALPYKDATQSGVLASAYGNSRPVVASATGGIPDVVTDGVNGLLVPPGNAAALADALERVLTSKSLTATLTDGARQTAAGQLNWDRIADGLLPSYRKLAGRTVS
ncbi:glycosyltransferase [Bradyrhizobium canariense]|uniref:Glycosyltransferase n=2 Tax=Bradyrhizobium canariense TaxID=255045 RepID=A0A1X3HE00_9BRAD|nr:glycosyltransferase [Bradyrhizobium canariense]OSI76853.1 glycosyltransferase [Bradyrhizobium canariense]OSI81926.1 glycosyltransferase [Bradyrhizobium canariense]OSI95823.1 glycosyltransferase [Bradyrhizobium canariense]OSI96558.1 glycosyltransferase [Bradyrhizobium canariense]